MRSKNEELLHARGLEISSLQAQVSELNRCTWGWKTRCDSIEVELMTLRSLNADLHAKISILSSAPAETSAPVVGVGTAAGGSATAFAPNASAKSTSAAGSVHEETGAAT